MSTNFPTSKDSYTNPTEDDYTATIDHAAQHSDANDALLALETKVGIDGSDDVGSIDYKLTNPSQVDPGHTHSADSIADFNTEVADVPAVTANTNHRVDVTTNPHEVDIDQVTPTTTRGDIIVEDGTNAVRLSVGTNDYVLTADSTDPNGVIWKAGGAGDMVTSVYDPATINEQLVGLTSTQTITNKTFGAGNVGINIDGVQRQLVGNGNFDIWQRGTTFTDLSNGYFTADRWFIGRTDDGAVDIVKSGLVPTIAESGVQSRNSLKATVTTADTSIASNQYYMIQQSIEGYNSSLYGFGKSDPGFFTFSFWVRATKTGIYCVAFRNESVDRSYVSEYTVNTSDTWEKKTITIPVDDTGTWSETTGKGLRFAFALAAGTNFHGTVDTWTASNLLSTANQVNALDTIGNTFNIAQVQINSGSVALPFQRKSISEEFAECQRHFEESNFYSSEPAAFFQYRTSSTISGIVNYNVRKMLAPTITISSFAKTNNKVSGETSPTDHAATSCTVRSQNSTVSGFGVITSTSTSFGSGGRYWFRWKAETGF